MQTNIILSDQTALAVDARVDKILKDLGSPKPPLRLIDARQLLKLDLGYYSTADTGWFKEKIHQLKIAGKQVLSAPSTIREVTKRLGLKGILLVDRRRILLDDDVAEVKLRWNEAHEITHDILPWHEGIAHGDPEATLSFACHEQIEAEANYGAGRLLFCGAQFKEEVRGSAVSFKLVKALKASYGNTMTTTLWRIAEATQHCAFGLVTVHPSQVTGDPDADIRYFIRSSRFMSTHAKTRAAVLFTSVCSQCHGGRGPIGDGVILVANDRGEMKSFSFETFWNHHDALTIAHYQ